MPVFMVSMVQKFHDSLDDLTVIFRRVNMYVEAPKDDIEKLVLLCRGAHTNYNEWMEVVSVEPCNQFIIKFIKPCSLKELGDILDPYGIQTKAKPAL